MIKKHKYIWFCLLCGRCGFVEDHDRNDKYVLMKDCEAQIIKDHSDPYWEGDYINKTQCDANPQLVISLNEINNYID